MMDFVFFFFWLKNNFFPFSFFFFFFLAKKQFLPLIFCVYAKHTPPLFLSNILPFMFSGSAASTLPSGSIQKLTEYSVIFLKINKKNQTRKINNGKSGFLFKKIEKKTKNKEEPGKKIWFHSS